MQPASCSQPLVTMFERRLLFGWLIDVLPVFPTTAFDAPPLAELYPIQVEDRRRFPQPASVQPLNMAGNRPLAFDWGSMRDARRQRHRGPPGDG